MRPLYRNKVSYLYFKKKLPSIFFHYVNWIKVLRTQILMKILPIALGEVRCHIIWIKCCMILLEIQLVWIKHWTNQYSGSSPRLHGALMWGQSLHTSSCSILQHAVTHIRFVACFGSACCPDWNCRLWVRLSSHWGPSMHCTFGPEWFLAINE